jgi:esterase/lipase superfamily enzyme
VFAALIGMFAARALIDPPPRMTASGEAGVTYGVQRGALQYGTCDITIPKNHQVGELESPSILRLEFAPDEKKHVVVKDVVPYEADTFYGKLREVVANSPKRDVFVFVHGYNVTFENAARRTAQMAYDLKFQGAPIFYSWPSQGDLLGYTVDANNVAWTVPHLKKFLLGVARESNADAVNLIAHSMGNRALTSALRELTLELRDEAAMFNQVVLAAPDIDAEVFRRDIAPAIVQSARHVTLYASSDDQALVASRQVHGYARAGDSGEGLVVIPGIETIDVSGIDTSLLGHSYYGASGSILQDLYYVIHEYLPAGERQWLQEDIRDGLRYWRFRTGAVSAALPPTPAPH